MVKHRTEKELPEVIVQNGWQYLHLGIPTDKKMPEETYIPHLNFWISGFPTSPFGVEWMRFPDDCNVPEIIKTVPHIAFVVDNLDAELKNYEILSPPGSPCDGVRVAMILHNGAPIELMEYSEDKETD